MKISLSFVPTLLMMAHAGIVVVAGGDPLYKIDICWISLNSYDGGWSTHPVDGTKSITLEEGETKFDVNNEMEVYLSSVDDDGNVKAKVTTHMCGCTDTFDATAVVGSGKYGPLTPTQTCRDCSDYWYDHQLQIRVAEEEGKGDGDSGSAACDCATDIAIATSVLGLVYLTSLYFTNLW